MKYLTGTTAEFEASFFTGGVPAELSSPPQLSFFASSDLGTQLAATPALIDEAPGKWNAIVSMTGDLSAPGWYTVRWSGISDGVTINGEENFEVVAEVQPQTVEANLRRRLRDTIIGTEDTDAFFSNDEVHTLLAMNNGSVIGASLDGWTIRAASYQMLVDMNESGSERALSQVFKNAKAMVDFYAKAFASETGRDQGALAGRIVGKVASLRGEYVDTFGVATMRGRNLLSDGAYVRLYPLKRFLPMLGGA